MSSGSDDIDLPLSDMKSFSRQLDEVKSSASDFSRILTSGLKAAVTDGKSLESVMKSMVLSLSSSTLSSALKPLTSLAGSSLSSLVSSLTGSATSGLSSLLTSGAVSAFADGGVVASPTYFGTGTGDLGLMGEAGAEAVMPLSRDSHGRLGVANGGASTNIVFNVTAQNAQSFRKSESQISAMVARAAGRGRRGL